MELGDEFCRACGYCQPCPQGIPISTLLRAESQFLTRMGWRQGTERQFAGYIEKAQDCIECGVCERQCPYQAIRLEPKPVFDLSKCYGCWRCYNRCPEQAIYTAKLRGKAHYPSPSERLVRKLSY